MAAARVAPGGDASRAAPAQGQLRIDLYTLPSEFDAWPARRSLNEVFVGSARRRRNPRPTPTRPQPPPPPPACAERAAAAAAASQPTKLTNYTWKNYAQTSRWLHQLPDMVYKSALCPRYGSSSHAAVLPAKRPTNADAAIADRDAPARARQHGGLQRSPYRAAELHVRALACARPLGAPGGRSAAAAAAAAGLLGAPAAFFVGSHVGSTLSLSRPLPREHTKSRRSRASSSFSQEDRCPTPKTYKSVASYRRIVEGSSARRPTAPLHCTRETSAVASRTEGEDIIINTVESLNIPAEASLPEWALEERRRDAGESPRSALDSRDAFSQGNDGDTFTLAVSIRSKV